MATPDKVIINAALTGMVPTKRDNPYVPITPEEIAADARRCVGAGASIIHLHARGDDESPTTSPLRYQEILRHVREACPDAILCASTSGRVEPDFERRSAVLNLTDPKPEMASLTLGSLNFPRQASMNAPDMIRMLAAKMLERGIMPELEIFEIGMAEYAHYLIKNQLLKPPFYANILLGNLGTLSASEVNLRSAIAALPNGTTWAAAGIGRFQHEVCQMAIGLGGHVRVGLEDNLWFDPQRTIPATNVQLVERVAELAKAAGRMPASPAEARQIIGFSGARLPVQPRAAVV